MFIGEGVPGAAFQIEFEILGEFGRFKSGVKFDFPWDEIGGVRSFSRVVFGEGLFEIGGMATI
jgi:hypothetical protein